MKGGSILGVRSSSNAPSLKKNKGVWFEVRKNFPLFMMLMPGTLFLLIFSYLPMPGILLAFKQYKIWGKNVIENFLKSKWVGLSNFKFLFSTPDAFMMTRNTVLYNLVFMTLGLLFSVGIAIAINEVSNKKLAKVYQTSFFLPYFLSWIVVSYLAFALLNTDYGVINGLLKAVGAKPIEWYMEPKYWPGIFVIANLWKYAGQGSIVYLAAITGFDQEIYESAAIDGASKWQQISKITIPLLIPMMTLLTILGVGRIFNADFGLFYSLPNGSGLLRPVSTVIDTYVFSTLSQGFMIGLSASAGLYQAVVGFILVLTTNLIVKKISPDNTLF
jgi:putative aldouronate transport system permease protein